LGRPLRKTYRGNGGTGRSSGENAWGGNPARKKMNCKSAEKGIGSEKIENDSELGFNCPEKNGLQPLGGRELGRNSPIVKKIFSGARPREGEERPRIWVEISRRKKNPSRGTAQPRRGSMLGERGTRTQEKL